ncbi:MAG: hypothetical protein AMXMBFR33_01600 [Candidatus Xenobia bacterium]
MSATPDTFTMRSPCCSQDQGYIVTKSGQDCVYCVVCHKHQYNAPKHETGCGPRKVSKRDALKPSQRWPVIERAHGRCETCGKRPTDEEGLDVGHILPVDWCERNGIPDEQRDHPDNLIAQCKECNLGQGKRALPPWLAEALLRARTEETTP